MNTATANALIQYLDAARLAHEEAATTFASDTVLAAAHDDAAHKANVAAWAVRGQCPSCSDPTGPPPE